MTSLLSWQALGVFAVAIVVDVVWGLYIRRAGEGRALAAAHYAALIMLFGAINVVSYTANHWFLLPIIAGNWLGTYAIVRHDHQPPAHVDA